MFNTSLTESTDEKKNNSLLLIKTHKDPSVVEDTELLADKLLVERSTNNLSLSSVI